MRQNPHVPECVPACRRLLGALVLLVLGAAGPALAQDAPGDPPLARPLELLLEHRESLRLTPDQLDRVAAIRQRLAAANDPLVNRMLQLRQEWQQQRRASRRGGNAQHIAQSNRIRAAAQRLHVRIQGNNRAAMQAVNRLLTPEQRARLRTIVEERRTLDASRAVGGSGDADGSD